MVFINVNSQASIGLQSSYIRVLRTRLKQHTSIQTTWNYIGPNVRDQIQKTKIPPQGNYRRLTAIPEYVRERESTHLHAPEQSKEREREKIVWGDISGMQRSPKSQKKLAPRFGVPEFQNFRNFQNLRNQVSESRIPKLRKTSAQTCWTC